MKTHIEIKHTIDKHLVCPYCDFKRILLSGFSRSLEKVKYHIDKKHPEHQAEKKHKCDVCNENFIFQTSIQIHKDFRHGKEKEDGEKNELMSLVESMKKDREKLEINEKR